MSYVTPSQLKTSLQDVKSYVDEQINENARGYSPAYIVGSELFAADWLSATEGGTPLEPKNGEVFTIATPGDYERLFYQFNGTKYEPVGVKSNRYLVYPDIVHNGENVSTGGGTEVKYSIRVRPADTTTKVNVRFNYGKGSMGGNLYYGIEGENVTHIGASHPGSGSINVTYNLEFGEKQNDIIVRSGENNSFGSSWVSNCVVTEMNDEIAYTYEFTPINKLGSQSGLVPKVPNEVGGTGFVLSDGDWHTEEEIRDLIVIDDMPITKEEISQAFIESYGSITPTGDIYSLEEMVIGRWIDGKPLYRKVVEATLAKNRSNIDVADLSIDKLILCRFISYTYDGGYSRSVRPDSQTSFFMTDATSITYDNNSSGVLAGALTIEYTKTTDSPNNIDPNEP